MRYSVQAAARITGVAEARLRTWERRYGVPRPERSPTGRRLYDEEDLAQIRRMAALTEAGVLAREAAATLRAEAASGPPAPALRGAQATSLARAAAALVRAAGAFDEPAALAAIQQAASDDGWPGAFDEVLAPALRAAGDSWERGEWLPAQEHFLAELVRRALIVELARLPGRSDGPSALLACAPSERHDLGLLALALALTLRGVRVTYLGADVPQGALEAAATRLGPDAVVLSATASTSRAALALVARALAGNRAVRRLFLGGAAVGVPGAAEPAGIRLPASVAEAAALIVDAVAPHGR